MDFSRNYILNIFIIVIVIFALIIFIDVSNINLNPDESNKKVVQIVNIEALKNQKKSKKTDTTNEEATTSETDTSQIVSSPEVNKPNTTINMSPVDDFCKSNSASLKESC
jgi:cytoskeletal protein RodZ